MTTNLSQIVDAISNKQFVAAQDLLGQAIKERLSDSLISRKDEVALDFGQEITNEEKDYEAFLYQVKINMENDLFLDKKKQSLALFS